MLNRRYESLQRSFRSAHHQRRVQTQNNLSPVESAGAISYLPSDSVGGVGDRGSRHRGSTESEDPSVPSSIARSKKEQKSDKKKGWFSLGRKNNRSVSQSPTVSDRHDNIIPIVSSPDILSPITPPPSLDELGLSLPPPLPHPLSNGTQSDSIEIGVVGDLELEQRNENEGVLIERNGDEAMTSHRNSAAAILDAMNRSSTQPRPQSNVEENVSPTHRVTNLDQVRTAAKAQRKISAARKHRSQSKGSGDTDDETDIRSPRTSVVSADIQSHDPEDKDDEEEALSDNEELKKQKAVGSKRKLSKGLSECPALKFITRPDLYTFLSASGVSGG